MCSKHASECKKVSYKKEGTKQGWIPNLFGTFKSPMLAVLKFIVVENHSNCLIFQTNSEQLQLVHFSKQNTMELHHVAQQH